METPDAVTRLNAALEGRYLIERQLGEGGMATVYLADDLKHERKVAVKVLKQELAAVVGADRFLSEIKTTANLQHPHILPLFDSGEADGLLFYVMPYVEGETLRERLERERQLPVDDAVRIASDVAEALDHAHRQGVVHRDMKPANILLRDGQPLVADFGIALAVGAAGGSRLTGTGISVGTPQYMSPEQATGDRAVGPATDVYSLGCVLYECLAGEPPYTGTSPQAILGRIITSGAVAIREHRSSVPANVEATISRALEKLPADRFRSAADFGNALSDPGFRHGGARERTRPGNPWKAVSALLGTVVLVLSAWNVWPDDKVLTRYNMSLPLGGTDTGAFPSRVVLSPDGTRYVFAAPGDDGSRGGLWIRDQSEAHPEPLPTLSGAWNPSISPDGESVAALEYLPGGRSTLVRAPLEGTGTVTLAEGDLDRMGHSWGDDGYIYIGSTDGVLRISESGGELETVTRVDEAAGETGHHSPVALPGGAGIVFTVRFAPFRDRSLYQIAAAGREGGAHRVLIPGVRAEYAAPGILLHVSYDGGLFATPFDVGPLEFTGQTTPIADDVSVGPLGAVDLTVSKTGKLVYGAVTGSPDLAELVLVSKDGSSRPLAPGWSADFRNPSVSPDGSRLAVQTGTTGGPSGIWVWSFDRGTRLPVSSGGGFRPAWTPTGARVGFLADSGNASAVWATRPDGSGEPELVRAHQDDIAEAAWSTDGRWLVYRMTAQVQGAGDIFSADLESGTEQALFDNEVAERAPALSPDGRWIAYTSRTTGIYEVWVASFPDVQRERHKISEGGGTEPRWSRDGRELFFRDGNDDMAVAEVSDGGEFTFTGTHPTVLRFPLSRQLEPLRIRRDAGRRIVRDDSGRGGRSGGPAGRHRGFSAVARAVGGEHRIRGRS